MSELVLYQYPGDEELPSLSPPCVKVQLALSLLQLPFRVVSLDSPLAVRAVSRTGRVPVLETPAGRLTDSVAILDVLESMSVGAGLHPEDPLARARDRAWEHLANDSIYWQLLYLRWLVPENRARTLDAMLGRGFSFKKMVAAFGGTRAARARAEGQGTGLKPAADVWRDLSRAFDLLQDGLGPGPFLDGKDRPGRGDLAVAGLLVQVGWRDALPDGQERLRARPRLLTHTRQTFEAAGLPAPSWVQAPARPAAT